MLLTSKEAINCKAGKRTVAFMMLVSIVGCNSESQSVALVTGKILVNGEPQAGISITTQPIAAQGANAGAGSFAKTDEQGRFELEQVKPARKGAIVGEHRVMISPPDNTAAASSDTDDPQGHIQSHTGSWPTEYTDGSLRLTVPAEGLTDADFNLEI